MKEEGKIRKQKKLYSLDCKFPPVRYLLIVNSAIEKPPTLPATGAHIWAVRLVASSGSRHLRVTMGGRGNVGAECRKDLRESVI